MNQWQKSMREHIFEIIALIGVVILISFISVIMAPPYWSVNSIKDEFGDHVRYVAEYDDSMGMTIKYHDTIPKEMSYYTIEIAESTGTLGVVDVILQDVNDKQYITYWDCVGYSNRLKIDYYKISGKHSKLMTNLIRYNDEIKVLLKDSAGDYVLKTIRSGGFDKICKKVQDIQIKESY